MFRGAVGMGCNCRWSPPYLGWDGLQLPLVPSPYFAGVTAGASRSLFAFDARLLALLG